MMDSCITLQALHLPTATSVCGTDLPSVNYARHEILPRRFRNEARTVPDVNRSRVLVIPKTAQDATDWIARELPEVDLALYTVDQLDSVLHPPKNKGHEAMIYLTYIIDHYHRLPDVIIFMHAHQRAWHNNEPLDFNATEMIRRLNVERVLRLGYMNLRCEWYPGCPEWLHPHEKEESLAKQEQEVLSTCWNELFPFDELPQILAQPCCAQFAVSREKIRSIPLRRFVFYRDWLLKTDLTDYFSGRIWEFVWQFVFTTHGTNCPPQHVCYCDGYDVCFNGDDDFQAYLRLHEAKKKLSTELQDSQRNHENAGKELGNAGMEWHGGVNQTEMDRETDLRNRIDRLQRELERRRRVALRPPRK